MNKAIEGRGWFVRLLSGLACCDPALATLAAGEIELLPNGQKLAEVLGTLGYADVARMSRKGWMTLDHPQLGCVQWKTGVTLSVNPYFFLRINGKLILKAWPEPGQNFAHIQWVNGRETDGLPRGTVGVIESYLGFIEK